MEVKSRITMIKLVDGTEVPLTINFAKLRYLQATGYKDDVKAALKLVNATKETADFMMMPDFFWVCYVCAASGTPELSKDEFIGLLPWELDYLSDVYLQINAKKKT